MAKIELVLDVELNDIFENIDTDKLFDELESRNEKLDSSYVSDDELIEEIQERGLNVYDGEFFVENEAIEAICNSKTLAQAEAIRDFFNELNKM